METFRLKNIVILILLLLNIFLLAILFFRKSGEYTSAMRLEQELQELFASSNVSLSAELPDEPPPASLSFTRSTDAEQATATDLLGENLSFFDDGGGTNRYQNELGQAVFYSNGNFSISGELSIDPAEDFCRHFCESYGYRDLSLSLDRSGFGSAEAVLYCSNLPVRNASISFLIQNNQVIAVSGTFLPVGNSNRGSAPTLSAATALTRFLDARRESGSVVSSVTDISLCYELEASASPLTLIPLWCISTDTVNYYVNCSTADVSHD